MVILAGIAIWIGLSVLFGLLNGKIIGHNEVCYGADAECRGR